MNVVYQLKIGGVVNSKNFFENVWHYQISESNPAAQGTICDALITAWEAAVQTAYLNCLGTDVVVNLANAKRINNGGGYTVTKTINQTGTSMGSASFSAAVAADIAWYPPGPSNKAGHTYICGIPTSGVVGDIIQAGYDALLVAFAIAQDALLPLGGGLGDALFGLYSRKTDTFTRTLDFATKSKLTGFNKRTLPVI
jgi:hypothetical protein